MLISRLGIDFLNEEFKKIGLEKTHIERLLFDSEASAQGKCNYIVPAEMGMLLEQVYRRTFVSKEVSEAIEKLLLEQQIKTTRYPATSATRSPLHQDRRG